MQPSKCKSCGAKVFLTKTVKGASMPVDAEPNKTNANILIKLVDGKLMVERVIPQNEFMDGWPSDAWERNLYLSHFATCPNAKGHRK